MLSHLKGGKKSHEVEPSTLILLKYEGNGLSKKMKRKQKVLSGDRAVNLITIMCLLQGT